MVSQEQIKKGVLLRLLSDYLAVPADTTATVEDLGLLGGVWWFTVRFNTHQPIVSPNCDPRRKRSLRSNVSSLRLREDDLAMLEAVNGTEIEQATSPARPPAAPKLPAGWRRRGTGRSTSVHTNQLSLFRADDF